jgi:hypothetical protein
VYAIRNSEFLFSSITSHSREHFCDSDIRVTGYWIVYLNYSFFNQDNLGFRFILFADHRACDVERVRSGTAHTLGARVRMPLGEGRYVRISLRCVVLCRHRPCSGPCSPTGRSGYSVQTRPLFSINVVPYRTLLHMFISSI